MSTLEKLFVQIFDRKNWIIDQLKQQSDSYDQYLASKLLINGIRPPSWLWSDGFEAGSSDLKGSKKEELISGLLFPPTRSKVPSSIGYNTFCKRVSKATNNGRTSDVMLSETCASSKYWDSENRSTVVRECHLNNSKIDTDCPLECVPEMHCTGTSPQTQNDVRMSGDGFEASHSLARFQRSRSRQKALELRNSAKENSKKRTRKESISDGYAGRVTRSRTSEQPQHARDLLEAGSGAVCSESLNEKVDRSGHLMQRLNSVETDADQCHALDAEVLIKRSRSGKMGVEISNFAEERKENDPRMEDTVNERSGRLTRSQSILLQSGKESLRPNKASDDPSGRVTRSRSTSGNAPSQVAIQCSKAGKNGLEISNFVESSKQNDSSIADALDECQGKLTKSQSTGQQGARESLSPVNSSKAPSGRVTRSRSMSANAPPEVINQRSRSSQNDLEISNIVEARKRNDSSNGDALNECSGRLTRSQRTQLESGNASVPVNSSKVPSGRVTRSRSMSANASPEVVNRRSRSGQNDLEISNVVEACKQNDSSNGDAINGCSGRLMRSQSTRLESGKESLPVYSSKAPSGRVTRSSSMSTNAPSQEVFQRSRSGQNALEISNFVEASKQNDSSNGDAINECSGRLVRSQGTRLESGKESSRPVNSSEAPSGRVTGSRLVSIGSSSQHETAVNLDERHDLLKVSGIHTIVHKERSSTEIAETKRASNVPGEAYSVCSRSSNAGACFVEELELSVTRPPFDYNLFVEPKQLVFDDVEDGSSNEVAKPALENNKWGHFPEMRSSSLVSTESFIEVPISVDLHEKCDISVDEHQLEKDQKMETWSKEKLDALEVDGEKRCEISRREKSERGYHFVSSGKASKLDTPITGDRPAEDYEDAVAARRSDSNKMSVQGKDNTGETVNVEEELKVDSGVHAEERSQLSGREICPESNKFECKHVESDVRVTKNICEKCVSPMDGEWLDRDQIHDVMIREENRTASSGVHEVERPESSEMDNPGYHDYPALPVARVSIVSPLSSNRAPSYIDGKLLANMSLQVDKISNQVPGSSDHVTPLHSSRDQTMEATYRNKDHRASLNEDNVERLDSLDMDKSGRQFCPVSATGRNSHPSSLSSKGNPSCILEVGADKFSEVENISKQVPVPSDHLTASGFGSEGSFESELLGDVGHSFSDVGVEIQKDIHGSASIGKLNGMLPEDSKLGLDACDSPKEAVKLDLNGGSDNSLLRKPDAMLAAQETVISSALSMDAARSSNLSHDVGKDIFLTRYNVHENDIGFSNIVDSSIQLTRPTNSAWENTWPQHKRRKLEGRPSNGFTTSPRITRVMPLQHEDIICRSSSRTEADLETVPIIPQHIPVCCGVEIPPPSGSESAVEDMCGSWKHRSIEMFQHSPKLHTTEDEVQLEQGDQDTITPFGVKQTDIQSSPGSSVDVGRDAQSFLKDDRRMNGSTRILLNVQPQFPSEDEQNVFLNMGHNGESAPTAGTKQPQNSNIEEHLSSYCSDESAHFDDHDLIGATQTMPEFEKFSIGVPTESILSCMMDGRSSLDELDLPRTANERIRVLEQLCRSTSMLTPLVHPSEYNLHETPGIYQSIPNGLLEDMDLRKDISLHRDDIEELKDTYNTMSEEMDCSFPGRSYSDCVASTSDQSDWDVWRPYTPPIGKLYSRIALASADHSSQKQQGGNPDLTCFRIDEDTSSSEGNGELQKEVDHHDGVRSKEKNSPFREPLADVTNVDHTATVSETEVFDSGIMDSVIPESNLTGTDMCVKQSLGNSYGTARKWNKKGKENQGSSIGGKSVLRATESLNNRLSKPKLSRKTIERKGSQPFVDKGRKVTNIVSNISSFIPLVQQKDQQPALITGKRDIKVKALEAAEAARRLEEKRENDRKLKKEAAKLERARLEQEKAKQLELQRKNKEEEAKKKEANLALRKRLREEEEKKEKERKRMCTEDARRQQKKLRAEKEERVQRLRTADEMESKRKRLSDEGRKPQDTEKEQERVEVKKTGTQIRTTKVSLLDHQNASNVHVNLETSDINKVTSNLGKTDEDSVLNAGGIQEPAYDISPFQSSDDEEDDTPNRKFIPSWAREKRVAPVLCSMKQMDPYEIFPPASFCSVSKVLLPRPRKNSK